MLKKSLLGILAAATISTSISFADEHDVDLKNVDLTPEAYSLPPYPYKEMGVYIQGDAGYLWAGWNRNLPPYTIVNSGKKGGYTLGGAIGYQVNPFMAAELGSFYVPNITFSNAFVGSDTIHSFFAYAAGKLIIPLPMLLPGLSTFIKAGLAYRMSKVDSSLINNSNSWKPVIGAGVQYYLTRDAYAGLQWMFVAKGARLGTTSNYVPVQVTLFNRLPAYNLVTFELGYRFTF